MRWTKPFILSSLWTIFVLASCVSHTGTLQPTALEPSGDSTRPPERLRESQAPTPATELSETTMPVTATLIPTTPAVTFPTTFLEVSLTYDQAREEVVLFGGMDPISNDDLDETWIWDGTSWARREPAISPPPRSGASMAFDPATQQVLLFGGMDQSGRGFQDTWLWDGENWNEAHPAVSPPSRTNAGLVTDPELPGVLLFGGEVFTLENPRLSQLGHDTWLWTGGAWERARPATSPPANYPSLAYDAARQQIILLISKPSGEATTSETWTFVDGNWIELQSPNAPFSRYRAALAYDQSRQQVVIFGGYGMSSDASGYLSDTWVWDGKDWTQVQDSLPVDASMTSTIEMDPVCERFYLEKMGTSRTSILQSDMVYDASRQRLLLLTVMQDVVPRFIFWTWDGTAWRKLMEHIPEISEAAPPGEGWVRIRAGIFKPHEEVLVRWLEYFTQPGIEESSRIEDFKILQVDGPYGPIPEYRDAFTRVYKIQLSVKPVAAIGSFWNDGNGSLTEDGWIVNKALALGETDSFFCDTWIKVIGPLSEYESKYSFAQIYSEIESNFHAQYGQ